LREHADLPTELGHLLGLVDVVPLLPHLAEGVLLPHAGDGHLPLWEVEEVIGMAVIIHQNEDVMGEESHPTDVLLPDDLIVPHDAGDLPLLGTTHPVELLLEAFPLLDRVVISRVYYSGLSDTMSPIFF